MPLPERIFLIGFRATGKTTVARLLAERRGLAWLDADVVLEHRTGKTIAEIFAESGEEAFRDLEQQIVAELCDLDRVVVALGGGAVLRPANRAAIAGSGSPVVWLRASAETIHARMQVDPTTTHRRPNLTNRAPRDEIQTLLADREGFYRQCATLVVDTEQKRPAEIADEILQHLPGPPA